MADRDHQPPRPVAAVAEWARLVAVITARGGVAMVLGFAIWAAGPALLGWHVTTVVSDSMQPAIGAGDVIAARPTPAGELSVGHVLLAHDPDHPDRLRLHRYDADQAGEIITRGDANPQADSSTIDPNEVLGVGVLRVPFVGTPIVWLQQEQWGAVAITVAVIAAVVVASMQSPVRRATAIDISPTASHPDANRARAGSVRRRFIASSSVIAVTVIAVLLSPVAVSHAAFSASSSNQATFRAAVATAPSQLRCSNNANGTVTITWHHPGGGTGFTTLVNGQPTATLGPDARTTTLTTQSLFTWSRQTVAVRSNLGGTWNATSAPVGVTVFSFLGLGSVRCA